MSERGGIGMKDVKPQLQARARELAKDLVPNGVARGDIWQARSPRREGSAPTSFCIWISRDDRAGGFKDYALGESGDVFKTIEFCLANVNGPKQALDWAKSWLGIEGASRATVQRVKAEARERSAEAEKADAAEKERKRKLTRKIWLSGGPLVPGTPAWTYLESARSIPMSKICATHAPGVFRAAPRCTYFWPELQEGDTAGGEDQAYFRAKRPRDGKSYHPALLAAMSPVNGGPNAGLHRTYLRGDGLGKADVPGAKKMIGQVSGCAINIWRGETGLSPGEAAKRGIKTPLLVCEGIEDALSIVSKRPDLRVWALGSLAQLASLPRPECASNLIIFADNDWEGSAAAEQLERASARLSRLLPTTIAKLEGFKDPNEALMAGQLNV